MAVKKKNPGQKKSPNRNALCPCGSGRAYKNCCARKRSPNDPRSTSNRIMRAALIIVIAILVIGGIILAAL